MSEYKTLDEIFPDGKPDGRKFIHSDTTPKWFQPYFKSRHGWCGLDENDNAIIHDEKTQWQKYYPPKQTKKVKMYKPVYKDYCQNYYAPQAVEWHTDKENFIYLKNEIIGWLELDAEIEE